MFSYLSYKEFSQSLHISFGIHLNLDEILNVDILFGTTVVISFN